MITTFFSRIGVTAVTDTLIGQQIALREASNEFITRYRNRATVAGVTLPCSPSTSTSTLAPAPEPTEPPCPDADALRFALASRASSTLPLLSSECPGWTCFAEKTQGEKALPYMSSVRTPLEITGILVKDVAPGLTRAAEADTSAASGSEVYHVSVTPCYDKKLEAARQDYDHTLRQQARTTSTATATASALYGTSALPPSRAVDLVLATSELADLLLGRATTVADDMMTMQHSTNDAVQRTGAVWTELLQANVDAEAEGRGAQADATTCCQFQSPAAAAAQARCATPSSSCTGSSSSSCCSSTSSTPAASAPPSLSLVRVPGDSASGAYANNVFHDAAHALFGVQLHADPAQGRALPWSAGSNSDLRAVSLEYIGRGRVNGAEDETGLYALIGSENTVVYPGTAFSEANAELLTPTCPAWRRTAKYKLWRNKTKAAKTPELNCTVTHPVGPLPVLWMATAYGFRNIQNIVKQGTNTSVNYDYVEVMACPSGCLNGGGQLRAVDVDRIQLELGATLKSTPLGRRPTMSGDADAAMVDGEAGAKRMKSTADTGSAEMTDAIAPDSSLRAQKALVASLENAYLSLSPQSPMENGEVCRAYEAIWGHEGSQLALGMLYGYFRAIKAAENLMPKW
jgi:hypothetical protein